VKTTRRLLLSLLAAAVVSQAADPRLLELVMPDARVAIGIDVGRMRSSPFSQSVSSGIHEADPELRKLLDAAGFDPLRDLQELLIVTTGAPKDAPVLLIARGSFDFDRLRSFALSAGSKLLNHESVEILTDPEKKSGGFALMDNSLIVGGSLEQVRAAISRRGRGMVINTELATRMEAMSSRYDAWIVSIAPLGPLAAGVSQEAVQSLAGSDMLKRIEQFSLGIGLSYDLTIAAEVVTKDDKDAGALGDGIQMLLGMAQKKLQEQPGGAEALKSLDFGVEGRTLHLGFTVPQAEVQKAIQSAWDAHRKPPVTVAAKHAAAPMREMVEAPELPPTVAGSLAPLAPAVSPGAQPAAAPVVRRPPAPAPARRLPANTEIMIQSSPKDMGTVIIVGGKK
jgi:hypothetical protein